MKIDGKKEVSIKVYGQHIVTVYVPEELTNLEIIYRVNEFIEKNTTVNIREN